MGDNRSTAKSSIQSLNVPSVTNAELNTMLQNYLADNIKFYADEAFTQASSTTNINLDFTGKDRIDLTRTGGALNITLSGLSDGDQKYILITKTGGQTISFANATDITPAQQNTDSLSTVLYEVIRKGSNYFAWAYVETVQIASSAEARALADTTKYITPETLGDWSSDLVVSIIDIGDWNMDTTATVDVDISSVTSSINNIRMASVTIRPDSNVTQRNRNLMSPNGTDGTVNGGIEYTNVSDFVSVELTRKTGGEFDSTTYNETSYNRGWITIIHTV